MEPTALPLRNLVSAARPKASSSLACTCFERVLISSIPRFQGLTKYLNCFSPAGVSIIRRTASATSWAFPAFEESAALSFAGISLTAPYVLVRASSAAVTVLPKQESHKRRVRQSRIQFLVRQVRSYRPRPTPRVQICWRNRNPQKEEPRGRRRC